MEKKMLRKRVSILLIILFFHAPSYAYLDAVTAENFFDKALGVFLQKPEVLRMIKEQNKKHATLTTEDINALDQKWRAGDKALIDPILSNKISKALKEIVMRSGGKYAEIFLMDNKGLNVAQSDKTSDYNQGDETKFQKTYSQGPHGIDIGKVKFDKSSNTLSVQVSKTITDEDGTPIGAATITFSAIDLEALKKSVS